MRDPIFDYKKKDGTKEFPQLLRRRKMLELRRTIWRSLDARIRKEVSQTKKSEPTFDSCLLQFK